MGVSNKISIGHHIYNEWRTLFYLIVFTFYPVGYSVEEYETFDVSQTAHTTYV